MTKPTEVYDCVGNILRKDDWVALHFDRPLLCKVVATEPGGIHTANGVTPAVLRLYADITLRILPGTPFVAVIAVREPQSQAIVEGLAQGFSKA